MASGAGTYTIHNTQNADATFLNSDGGQVTLIPGSTGVFSITASVWASLTALLGAANVVAQVVNPTYKYAILAFTPVATPTDVVVIQGSATKTVNITKIKLSGAATSQGALPFQIVRRSTAGTLGSAVLTAVAPTLTDTNIAAATAVVSTVGTANYGTLGTQNPTGGVIDTGRIGMPAITTGPGGDAEAVLLKYGDVGGQPLKLRGASDYICINGASGTVASGGVLDIVIETYEDNS